MQTFKPEIRKDEYWDVNFDEDEFFMHFQQFLRDWDMTLTKDNYRRARATELYFENKV